MHRELDMTMDTIHSQTEHSPILPSRSALLQPVAAPAQFAKETVTGPFELVIRPRSGWIAIDWNELLAYRELLWFLIWRDISVRYKQTVLGSAWAIVQPLTMMAIFTLIFGRFTGIDTKPFPYPVFVFAGLIPWTLFAQGFAQASLSLVSQHQLLTKVYFPRILVPTAAASVYMIDLLISLGLYACILLFYRVVPSWQIVYLPLLIALTLMATLSIGLTLSALTVLYRDFRHIVPFLSQIFLYFTPIIYPIDMIRSPLARSLMSLNPMFGIVAGYRSAILGVPWDLPCVAISVVTALLSFVFGVFYFRRIERLFADFA
jgi:lipopolysaccharide transport system permease protein